MHVVYHSTLNDGVQGHLKDFPTSLTGAWSSGTGMAGVGGSVAYLALSSLGINDAVIFGSLLLTVPVYWWAFSNVVDAPGRSAPKKLSGSSDSALIPGDSLSIGAADDAEPGLEPAAAAVAERGGVDAGEAFGKRVSRCLALVTQYGVPLFFVYFFEYVISVGAAAVANGPSAITNDSDDYFIRHSYGEHERLPTHSLHSQVSRKATIFVNTTLLTHSLHREFLFVMPRSLCHSYLWFLVSGGRARVSIVAWHCSHSESMGFCMAPGV